LIQEAAVTPIAHLSMRVLVVVSLALPLGGDAATDNLGLEPEVAGPAVISTGHGRLEVFIRGENNELVQRSWNGTSWSGWKNLGGDISAAPTVTSSRPGRLDVFVRGGGGDLVHRFFEGGRWSGWDNLGGDLTSAPSAVSPAPGRIEVFVRGMSGELVQRTYRDGAWGGWRNHGTPLASAPAAIVDGTNIEVFARGTDFDLIQRSYDGAQWSPLKNLGGDLTAGPAAAAGQNGIHVLIRGMNNELVHRVWNGTSWSGWENLGGTITAAPAAAVETGRIEVFVRGAGNDLVQRTYDAGQWSGWKNLGGDLRGRLRARLRLLTHNVYGLDDGSKLCAARAREFGRHVAHAQPAYDVVAVQEYYDVADLDVATCDAGPLSESMWSTGRYRNSDNYYRFYPDMTWPKPDGGVGIFTLHAITRLDDWRWENDSQRFLKSAEGFIFARINIPGAGITLDTYVVHLNSGADNDRRRRLQLRQLRGKVIELSRESGNPVIIMGDLNIGGPPSDNGNSGYREIRSILRRPKDLWLEAWPRNNGWTDDCTQNSFGDGSSCSGGARIDYILVVTDPALTSSPYLVTIAKRSDVSVVRWRVDRDRLSDFERVNALALGGSPHVSDHFGVEATIEIRDR
jgi:endonuclease/exonuclease/phosphatase family metal-dependent hydrolase